VPSSPDRIKVLIEALGDPQHPDHVSAVDTLVSIGSPAVPLLSDALTSPQQSWLVAYRGAETLGYIGDGNATGALIQALRHPNSNVRWSAVRSLSQIGDLRAIFELRRIAHEDHGRTSWGEPVAGAAQSALDQMRTRSLWGQGIELIKTAITSVLMILALILAFSVVTTLRGELDRVGEVGEGITPPGVVLSEPVTEAEPEAPAAFPPVLEEPTPTQAEPQETPTPTIDLAAVATGNVLQRANVRPAPSLQNEPIGQLNQGDEVLFLARNDAGSWYLVRLGENHAETSEIDNPNGSTAGWISASLLTEPDGDVPVEEPVGTVPDLSATDEPTDTPEE
jgi:hypothetical protein